MVIVAPAQAMSIHAIAPALALSASPNPFNPRTTIAFTLDKAKDVAIDVHDLRGRHVRALLAPTPLGVGRFHPWPTPRTRVNMSATRSCHHVRTRSPR
jgi:hypothetical protein